jgi:hypothetical protein
MKWHAWVYDGKVLGTTPGRARDAQSTTFIFTDDRAEAEEWMAMLKRGERPPIPEGGTPGGAPL